MEGRLPVSGSTLIGAAVGLVLGCVVLFAMVGALRDDGGDGLEVADDASSPTAAPSDADDSDGPDDGSGPVDDPATAEPTPSETPTAEPTQAPSDDPSPSEDPTVQPPAEEVDPADVSIQVLDALGGEDTSVADAVAAELRDAGYNVVVVNRAGRTYDVTTVFWSSGRQDAGRQVAAELGASRAEETPQEVQLSDSVWVHVVVGTDRA